MSGTEFCLILITLALCFGNWNDGPLANQVSSLKEELRNTNKILEVICQEIRNKNIKF